MKASVMIESIMTDNRMGKRFSKKDVAAIVAGCTGKPVPQCYITRWLRDEISTDNYNTLNKVWEELCAQ